MNVKLTTLGKAAKLAALNIYMPKGNTEKHKRKTCYAAISFAALPRVVRFTFMVVFQN